MGSRAQSSLDAPDLLAKTDGPDGETAPTVTERIGIAPGVGLDVWFSDELGNSSYVLDVADAGYRVVVDPWRDIDLYLPTLDRQRDRGILAVETHIHNDFVSGSRELIAQRAATLGASAEASLRYPHRALADGDEIPLGSYRLGVWATPGHTPEHVSYLLIGPGERPIALFSGGALMVGSAARTDLLGPTSARPLALRLHRTLHDRIARLPDSTRVFPTHGGGTFCGMGSSDRRTTTMGEERRSNPLLRATTVEAFLSQILEQRPYPRYFDRMRRTNLDGAPLGGFHPSEIAAMDLEAFDKARLAGALVVDLRPFVDFDAAHIPESSAFGIDGAFSAWVGWLLPPDRPLVFVAEDTGTVRRAVRQLFRIGYDRTAGSLRGGIETWKTADRPLRSIPRTDSHELLRSFRSESPFVVLDVRERYEYATGHIPGALSLPLGELPGRVGEIPPEAPLVVHCAHGYRSAIALSLLEREGFTGLIHADEGYEGWSAAAAEL